MLGRAEPALWHARRSLEICERHGLGDCDLAFAYEALARASALSGDRDAASAELDRARAAAAGIADADDRETFLQELGTVAL
jgi:hypothetical protein